MMRRRRSFRRFSRSRRRTRWFALVPHALTPTTDDSWDSQVMEIEDAALVYEWSRLVGGTLLRTIVDFVIDPNPGQFQGSNPLFGSTCSYYEHLGIAMTQESSPSQDRWDPNEPHGDFMWRHFDAGALYLREGPASQWLTWDSGFQRVVRADIRQRRRINEDDRLWAFAHTFFPGDVDGSMAVGYTGRVLIALP